MSLPTKVSASHLRVVALSYGLPVSLIGWILLAGFVPIFGTLMKHYWFLTIHLYSATVQLFLYTVHARNNKNIDHYLPKEAYQVGWRSALLGYVLALGLGTILFSQDSSYIPYGLYLSLWSLFHISEFVTTAMFQPSSLSLSSFLIDHSTEYYAAMSLATIEFWIERWLFSPFKSLTSVSIIGLVVCIIGEVIRKLAMITAGDNFSHIVRTRRDPRHRLITQGIYSWVRHPSYSGWALWAVGTQILLINPISALIFALAAWSFFRERISSEERILIAFFGDEYREYRRRVPHSGIPFLDENK